MLVKKATYLFLKVICPPSGPSQKENKEWLCSVIGGKKTPFHLLAVASTFHLSPKLLYCFFLNLGPNYSEFFIPQIPHDSSSQCFRNDDFWAATW